MGLITSIRFGLLFLGLFLAQKATAQVEQTQDRHNIIKFSPLSLIGGQVSVFYERSLTRRTSLVAGYGFGNSESYATRLKPGGVVYQRATVEIRRYMSQRSLSGFYWGPYLRLSQLTGRNFVYDQQHVALKDSEGAFLTTQEQTLVWIPGGMIGFQTMNKWISLDIFFGLQRQIVIDALTSSNQFAEAMTATWAPRVGLSVGFPF